MPLFVNLSVSFTFVRERSVGAHYNIFLRKVRLHGLKVVPLRADKVCKGHLFAEPLGVRINIG